jgi:L-fucose isomerase-like protein
VLVQATPDKSDAMTIATRRDSFCGKMSACNNLMQYGIPYSLTTLHTEAPASPEFKADLEWFGAVCRVVRGLKNLRIGAIGARPHGLQHGALLGAHSGDQRHLGRADRSL